MDTFLLIVILIILVGALVRKYSPDNFQKAKDKVLNLVKRK